ncbi:MAG: hypothetical protein ACYTG4_02705 [Planctomycetota bacterium]|jgi:hypothetical protein
MKTRITSAFLVAALLGAATTVYAQEEGEKPAKPEAVEETDDQRLERMTGAMMKEVERLRGLEFKSDVKRVWKSRDEAKAEMLKEIDRQLPPEKILAASKTLAFFGTLKEGQDLKDVFAEFISAGAGGYYIPDQKTFSLVRGYPEAAATPIIFHELVHAVEDQYYDFDERTKKYMEDDRDDMSAALHALVEGSARTYENIYVDDVPGRRMKYTAAATAESMKHMGRLMKLPPQLVMGVGVFPYNNGSSFIAAVKPKLAGEGEGAKDHVEFMTHLFENPPVSTEQILHPEKYLDETRDLPQMVKLPALESTVGEGWKELLRNTMGEFGLAMGLNTYLHPNNFMGQMQASMAIEMRNGSPVEFIKFKGPTEKAASGWDGDRYATFAKGDDVCAVWVSSWDSDEDANEFVALYSKVIEKKYKVNGETAEGRVTFNGTRNGTSAIEWSGSTVWIAERVPTESLDAVLKALRGSTVTQDEADTVPAR